MRVVSRFRVFERTVRGRKKLVFCGDDGGFYRLGDLRNLEYTIEELAMSSPQSETAATHASLFA